MILYMYMHMETEIEATFLGVDKELVRAKLKSFGAKLIHSEKLMRRKVFDFEDRRLNSKGAWVRVRDEGNQVTLSFKIEKDKTVLGTSEVMVVVDDFDKTCKFLEAIGLEVKAVQETKREKWEYDRVEVCVDTWPWIPTYVELEGSSEEGLKSLAGKLSLDWKEAKHGSGAYGLYYDVSEDTMNKCPEIVFSKVPDWLVSKKIKEFNT
jgi:adenylate cyclase class 2